jgi:hypothetical protein
MKRTIIFLLLTGIALSACRKKPTEPPPPSPTINGTWQGSGTKIVNGIRIDYTITADLAQQDTTITGTGNIATIFLTVPFTVSGKNIYPNVSLFMANTDSTFTGTYIGAFMKGDDNTIDGAATVPAFQIVGEPLTIKRIK